MKSNRESETRLQGIPVSEGIAIGSIYFLKPLETEVPNFAISHSEVDAEVARYRKAIFSSKEDLQQLRQDLALEGSEDAVDTIETHIQMLDDPMITTDMEGKIRQQLRNTESVFHSVIHDYENRFSERSDSFFHERLVDVKDVSKRILNHLNDKRDARWADIPTGSVILSDEIAPSCIAGAQATQIGAFLSSEGGGNSHAALIARSKGIPFITGIDCDEIDLAHVDLCIVDGFEGVVVLNPSEKTLMDYREKQKLLATRYQGFLEEDHLSSETVDGYETRLFVNVGNVSDLEAFPYSHCGIGLFRTEYLFLQAKDIYPSEEYQVDIYRQLLAKMDGRPLVIRVFDLGGDKNPSIFRQKQKEPNPVLGNRGIRFLLRNTKIFKSQLRAIFRSASGGNVRILLPLISDINELLQSKEIIEEVRKYLASEMENVPKLPIGCMIEVPSAVMICDALASQCDFLSMGTNDLVQYTLGVDRGNPAMRELYYPAHPSILRMIKLIALEAKRREMSVTICGEMASNILFTPLLLGLGLRDFSVAPRYIPYLRRTIRKWSIVESYKVAEQALRLTDPKEISRYLTEIQKKN